MSNYGYDIAGSAIASGTFTTAEAKAADSLIARASSDIAESLSRLEQQITQLDKRLHRVQRPVDPSPTAERLQQVANSASEHTAELRKHAEFIDELSERVVKILDRLDV